LGVPAGGATGLPGVIVPPVNGIATGALQANPARINTSKTKTSVGSRFINFLLFARRLCYFVAGVKTALLALLAQRHTPTTKTSNILSKLL
jgi:hypothetical protein